MKKILIILVIVAIVFLIWCFASNGFEFFEMTKQNPMKFGLILRSKVPKALKMQLNAFNERQQIFKITTPLPDHFDCREKWPGLITTPLDQADCGSCWAFAVCTSASDRIRITDPSNVTFMQTIIYRGFNDTYQALNNLDPFHLAACDLCSESPVGKELSKQALCGVGPESSPCKGEVLQVALQYIQRHGAIDVACSPRQKPCIADPQLCFYSCDVTDCKLYKPLKIHPLNDDFAEENTSDVERADLIRYEVMTFGPVVAGYTVTQSFMDFFKDPDNSKKVFTQAISDASGNDKVIGGHAIVIGGWGVDPETGTTYWLIRNSWGTSWGDDGWFRLESGINFMGIGNDVWATHWSADVI